MININWKAFSKIIYINLAHRRDRNVKIKRQLRELNAPREKVIRFDAIKDTPGTVGCVKSHIAVLEMAMQNNWENVLILEDDFVFNRDGESISRLNTWLRTLDNISWDVGFLAANYHHVTPLKSVNYLVRANKAWCACAYWVNRHYYPSLLCNLRQSLSALENGGDPQRFALDVHWWHLMMKDCWVGLYPCAGYQAIDKSDIEQMQVDYRSLFFKPLNTII